MRVLPLSNESRCYRKMVKNDVLYTSHKNRNNSFALLDDGSYIRIIDFLFDRINQREYTICNNIKVQDVLPDYQYLKCVLEISIIQTPIETSRIKQICVSITENSELNDHYLCAVPNSLHY